MGNQLTHGLLAGAFMAIANLLLGIEPISWNVFLAAIVAISMNLDSGDARVSEGSPVAHSLGFGLFIIYIAGVGAYFSVALLGMPADMVIALLMAVGTGVMAHLLAEIAVGERVFTFPRNLRPENWLVKCDCRSPCFWPAWSRFSLPGRHMSDSHLNAFSLAAIIIAIGLF
ncbi:MAG: hypothetical protein R6W91_07775 [Thermoplasmata archaeon]